MTPEQIPPPPRIKAWPWNGKRISGQWHVAGLGETTDYVRGDLFAAQAAELATLRAAAQALGAMPEGYCFCSKDRIGDDSKTHEPECADLRIALKGGDA